MPEERTDLSSSHLPRDESEVVFDAAVREMREAQEQAPRFPVRWRFTLLVGLMVLVAVATLLLVLLDLERKTWLTSQKQAAEALVARLADELKIPMLAGSKAEIDVIVANFLKRTPDADGVHLVFATGEEMRFGKIDLGTSPLIEKGKGKDGALWFVGNVRYAGTEVGRIAVKFSERAWKEIVAQIVKRMLVAAVIVVVLAMAGVYWLAGYMSQPLEELAEAARAVAYGDYTVRLPIRGNDELADAIAQFNALVAELQHKEEIRNVFGRYLNPKLVSEVFEMGKAAEVRGHRQEVTVLFADMVDFTAFSESAETEKVIEVLNQHFEVFHRIIDYYGGHVDKYIGDAVMAVFNHPNEDPSHPRSAAKAGIAMTLACEKLGVLRPDGRPIRFRVGLNCGEVIVGDIGAAERLEYTVIGDTVNVASRLTGLGEGGQVVMTRKGFERLGEGFVFHSLGEQQIKGIRKPVECGVIEAVGEDVQHNIRHAVALAFDLTLPSGVRAQIEDEG